MRHIDQIGISCLMVFVGWIAGIYTAFGAGNQVINLNIKTHENARRVMEREWRESCVWWYLDKRIEGAPVLCSAPGFLVK